MRKCNLFSALILFVFIQYTGGQKIVKGDTKVSDVIYEVLDLPTVNLSEFPKEEDGWISLFDGKTFKGWRGYNRMDIPNKWSIEDGSIRIHTTGTGGAGPDGGDILFAHKFRNFEFEVEWKVAKGANSGVFYFIQEVKGENASQSAPESQILDNKNHPDAKLGENGNRKSSSLYDLIPANPQNAKPYGEWNKTRIRCVEGEVTHFQNEIPVVKYHLWTSEWKQMLDNSKFSKNKNPVAYELLLNCGGEKREGFIGFQDHGDDVWFRNIRIKVFE